MSSSLFACATDNINAISTQRTADHVSLDTCSAAQQTAYPASQQCSISAVTDIILHHALLCFAKVKIWR